MKMKSPPAHRDNTDLDLTHLNRRGFWIGTMDGNLPAWLEMLLTVLLEWETLALESLHVIFDQIGWVGVSGLVVLETSTGIGTSEVTLGLAGWLLLAEHKLPASTVISGGLYAAVASLVGASIQYWAARLGGRPLVDRISRWVRLNPKHIERVEAALQQRGAWFVVAGRIIPFVRTVISAVAGLARVPYPAFAAATFGGAFIYCTILVGAGYFLGKSLAARVIGEFPWTTLGENLGVELWLWLAAALAVLAGLIGLTWVGIRRLRQ